jgi:hypothetical protein
MVEGPVLEHKNKNVLYLRHFPLASIAFGSAAAAQDLAKVPSASQIAWDRRYLANSGVQA